MADQGTRKEVPQELLGRIALVKRRRARVVLESIANRGLVTTEELLSEGLTDGASAARDARDLGFPIKTIRVKNSNGRSIGAYVFDEKTFALDKQGRRALPKKERDALIRAGGNECRMCRAKENLQVDHRVPFYVAGESLYKEQEPYQILDGACNRKKSWACEHCPNWLDKIIDVCLSCYWASPVIHTHVATKPQRRAEMTWVGNEVRAYDELKKKAENNGRTVTEEIKAMLASIRRKQ